jgi:hypothetical protein
MSALDQLATIARSVRLAALALVLAVVVVASWALTRPAASGQPIAPRTTQTLAVAEARNAIDKAQNLEQCPALALIYAIDDPHATAGSGTSAGGLETKGMSVEALALYQQALRCLELVKVVDSGGDKVSVVDTGPVSSPGVPLRLMDTRVCIQPGHPIPAGSFISLGSMCGYGAGGRGTAVLLPTALIPLAVVAPQPTLR